jgi:hypothetical protein
LVFPRRFGANKIADKVVPAAADHVGFVAKTVGAIRKQEKIEILVGFDELVHDEKGVVRRDVGVCSAVREE